MAGLLAEFVTGYPWAKYPWNHDADDATFCSHYRNKGIAMRRAVTKARGEEFAIGGLAAETGVKIETIRYYERIALLPEPQRTQSGRRAYGREDILRLGFIKRARELGFAIEDIRALLSLAEGSRDCAATRVITLKHLDKVRGKISSLRRLEEALTRMTDACHLARQFSCPIIEALGGVSAGITSPARR